jgi:CheY-like chemotaxis protein
MKLQSLVVCSDDRIVRLLRNVLGELEIEVEHCSDSVQASKKLAQQRFEAVIIDCKDRHDFSLLQGIRSGDRNRRSMTVAIIDARSDLHATFESGANFVVYKPISSEKAKSSFRAARALMQRERRRSVRLHVNIPAYFRFENGDGEQATISGLSEGGLSVRFGSANRKKAGTIGLCFALPETTTVIEATGLVAWQDTRYRAGIQFATIPDASRRSLKDWLEAQSGEKHDPPIACKLAALSASACFLETQSAFPVQTNVELLLRAADCSLRTKGSVAFMDPELGMGIEFTGRTGDQRRRLEELIERVTIGPESAAEVLVEPEGLDWKISTESSSPPAAAADESQDRLVELFKNAASFSSREQFVEQLEPLRLAVSTAGSSLSSGQRSEPRIAVSRPAQLLVQGSVHAVRSHPTSMIELSHHGARIDHSSLSLQPGDPVHLISGGHDVQFRVIWVGEPGTAEEGQIGLQKSDD